MAQIIFLTGSTGFIGYNIARQLLKTGYTVRMLARTDNHILVHENAEYVSGDIRNYEDVRKSMKGCNIVIHTAGLFTFDTSLRNDIYETNVTGTENICKAVVENKPERFIYTSSAATIGKDKDYKCLSNENTKFNLWKISSHYKKSKVLAEEIVLRYYMEYAIPVVILNPSLPLGAYDFKPTSTGMMIKSFLNSSMKIYINGGFNFVHVNDVAKAHILALQRGRTGQKYIIGNENLLLKEFYQKLLKYKPDTKIKQVPYFVALLGAWVAVMFGLLTKKQPVVTPRVVQLSGKKMFYDTSKSQEELGIKYTSVDEAIKDSVNWFMNNK